MNPFVIHTNPVGRDVSVRKVVRSWRTNTSRARGVGRDASEDRRTLIACSGGCDSSALAIALATASRDLVISHVVHDLRPEAESLGDRDATRELAEMLGLGFVEARVEVAGSGENAEAAARRARYGELARLAREHACGYVATGHHAGDQLETMVMALARGAGPSGLAGIRERRELADGVTLIRPMLGIERADAARICGAIGWSWRDDATNLDTDRTRAAVRAVLPALLESRQGAALRAVDASWVQGEVAALLREMGEGVVARARREEGALVWEREDLRGEREVVLCEALRIAVGIVCGGEGMDSLTQRALREAAGLLLERSGEQKCVRLGTMEIRLEVSRVCCTAG